MIDLDERLQHLADGIVVPPAAPGDDLVRGRRRRRRRRWTATAGATLAAASVVGAVAWGPGLLPHAQQVGPADRSAPTRDAFANTDERPVNATGQGLSALESDLRATVVRTLGLEEAPLDVVMVSRPDYDPSGSMVAARTAMGVEVPRSNRVAEVDVQVARSWDVTGWRTYSCHPACDTYELGDGDVQTGTYDGSWVWGHERADGTVVTVQLDTDPARLGVGRAQLDRLLQEAALPAERDEPAGWGDALSDMAMDHLPAGGYSLRTGMLDLGPSMHAVYVDGPRERGELLWEGELLDTAPAGCPAEFARCERRTIGGVPVTLKHVGEGAEEGYVWVEHDGARVRSRMLLEPHGDAYAVALERVAALLADPTWQQMPASQSVTTR
jgi:hypothetical protein